MSDTQPITHVFEQSGHGHGPYKLVTVNPNGGGECDHCGTRIKVECHILSADGVAFIVGNQCVKKTGDAGLVRELKAHERFIRQIKADSKREALRLQVLDLCKQGRENIAALRALPHRRAAQGGYFASASLWDEFDWWAHNAGNARRVIELAAILEIAKGAQS